MPGEQNHPRLFTDQLDDTTLRENAALGEARLTQLFQERIEPIINRYFGSKLHVSLRPNDDSRSNQDAVDLVSETKVLVLRKLVHQDPAGEEGIRDLDAYVRIVASNVFNQYIRRKYPRRLSLKNQLRYLLTHHERLASWKNDQDEWLCGLSDLRDCQDPRAINFTETEINRIHSHISGSGARMLIDFTLAVFEILERPVLFDDLVGFACNFLRIEEPIEVAEPENMAELNAASKQASAISEIEDREFVRRLWNEVKLLPARHRAALLLNFREDTGEDLITMLPIMRIATIRQIAAELGFAPDDFAKVWNELPWDDNRISEHLGITRQQVINLRQSARQTLRRKMQQAD